jgi:hypothetical protein
MSRYLLLLRNDPQNFSCMSPTQGQELMSKFIKWTEGLHQAGHLAGVERLAQGGQTLRKRGEVIAVDGPYAEAKEAVAGLYILDAQGPDEALHLAQGCPVLQVGGSVEVRPIDNFPKPA